MMRRNPRHVDWAAVRRRMATALATTESLLNRAAADPSLIAAMGLTGGSEGQDRHNRSLPVNAVAFEQSGQRYSLDSRFVESVSPMGATAPVPKAPAHLIGVCPLRGMLLPVFDLSFALGMSMEASTKAPLVVACGEAEPEFLLLAESVAAFHESSQEDLQEQEAGFEFVRGRHPRGTIVLDGSMLLNDPLFFVDGSIGLGRGEGEDAA